jgi:Ran GTPase-activating protein (RanGAP) involved in mRNA processing and transport
VAAVRSGLKKNATLRELTLQFPQSATNVSPILTSLRDHPLLRRLSLRGHRVDLTGLETVLLSDASKITELDIHRFHVNLPMMGLTHVLQALGRRPTLTKLGLRHCRLGRNNARLLGMVLRNTSSLKTLVLIRTTLGSAGLEELATVLYHNTSIKELGISYNGLVDMESAEIFRDILRRNKTMTTLDLSGNNFGKRQALLITLQMGGTATQRC